MRAKPNFHFPAHFWLWLWAACVLLLLVSQAQAAVQQVSHKKTAAKTLPPKRSAKSQSPQKKAGAKKGSPKKAQSKSTVPQALSDARKAGLHHTYDPLGLTAAVVYAIDANSGEVLLRKNDGAILPIASLTKLMTAVLIAEAMLPLNETITITQEDVDKVKNSSSRLSVGAQLERRELLKLVLMSSENRAAHALARTWPGGRTDFVQRMNERARQLGMVSTYFADSSGLSPQNRSNARDLARLVQIAHRIPRLREFSTTHEYDALVGGRRIVYRNSNGLVRANALDGIALQKTGFINESGRCLAMQLDINGRDIITVFLDSVSPTARENDVKRVYAWIERQTQVQITEAPEAR